MKPNIGQKIVLAENKSSQYKIVLPKHATTYELRAATVLQDYLIQVSGAALPIVTSDKSPKSQEIIIGQNERLDELAAAIDYRLLKEDGFVIWTDSTRLIIAGGSEKGSLYGVYSFLEQYLGCRMYSSKVKIIPHQNTVILGKINDRQVPVITFRDTHYRTTWDAEYTDWHKLDHAPDGERTDWTRGLPRSVDARVARDHARILPHLRQPVLAHRADLRILADRPPFRDAMALGDALDLAVVGVGVPAHKSTTRC